MNSKLDCPINWSNKQSKRNTTLTLWVWITGRFILKAVTGCCDGAGWRALTRVDAALQCGQTGWSLRTCGQTAGPGSASRGVLLLVFVPDLSPGSGPGPGPGPAAGRTSPHPPPPYLQRRQEYRRRTRNRTGFNERSRGHPIWSCVFPDSARPGPGPVRHREGGRERGLLEEK